MKPESQSYLQSWTEYLVARDGFRRLLVRLGCGTVTVGMPVAVSNRRGNADRLARVREISRHRLGDIPDRADLHDRRLRLLQHQLFVNGPDLGLFRSEEHTSELQSHLNIVCRLLLEKKKKTTIRTIRYNKKNKKNTQDAKT